jgi:hypothetical protein
VHISVAGLVLSLIAPRLRSQLFYTSHGNRRTKKQLNLLDRLAIFLENRLVKRVRKVISDFTSTGAQQVVKILYIETGSPLESRRIEKFTVTCGVSSWTLVKEINTGGGAIKVNPCLWCEVLVRDADIASDKPYIQQFDRILAQ